MREKSQHPSIPKLERQIKGKFRPRQSKSRKEEAEFGPGKKDILVCRKCGAFYWHKSWRARLADYPELEKSGQIKFVLCPACQMILDKKYEGEIVLEAVPEKFKKDIKTLVKNYGKRAFEKDPMDRVISIKETKEKYIRILTTENQLAVRLAKKINETYGGKLRLSISYSHREDVARARIRF